MAIAFVNVVTAQANASTTALTVSVPSGVANGNLMVTVIEYNAAVTTTQPGGWTQMTGFPATSGTNVLDAWWRIAASEPGGYTWSFGSSKANIVALAYSGTTATPIEATTAAAATSSPGAGTGILTAAANDWSICAFSDRDSSAGSTWTTPSFTTARANMLNTGSSQGSLAVFDSNAALTAGGYAYSSTSSTTQSNAVSGVIGIIPASTGSLPTPINIRQAVNRATTF